MTPEEAIAELALPIASTNDAAANDRTSPSVPRMLELLDALGVSPRSLAELKREIAISLDVATDQLATIAASGLSADAMRRMNVREIRLVIGKAHR